MDCIYVEACRSFLVALSGNMLVLIPEGCTNTASCERVAWPAQPRRLLHIEGLSGGDVEGGGGGEGDRVDCCVVCCDGGYVCQINFQKDATKALPPAKGFAPTSSSASSSSKKQQQQQQQQQLTMVDACVSGPAHISLGLVRSSEGDHEKGQFPGSIAREREVDPHVRVLTLPPLALPSFGDDMCVHA